MKTVLVTGCSSGIGKDLVQRFLRDGHQVVATMRNLSQRQELFSELKEKYGEKLLLVELDITHSEQRKILIEGLDRLDLLVNNAGFGLFGTLEDMDEQQIRYQMEVNFFGTAFMIRDCLPLLRQSRGKIINISSLMGRYSMPLAGIYSASKYALEGLTEGLFYELRPLGVQICTVRPGRHHTGFNRNLIWAEKAQDQSSAYRPQTESVTRILQKMSGGPSLSNVSRRVVSLSRRKNLPARVYVGRDAVGFHTLRSLLPDNLLLTSLSKVYSSLIKGT